MLSRHAATAQYSDIHLHSHIMQIRFPLTSSTKSMSSREQKARNFAASNDVAAPGSAESREDSLLRVVCTKAMRRRAGGEEEGSATNELLLKRLYRVSTFFPFHSTCSTATVLVVPPRTLPHVIKF